MDKYTDMTTSDLVNQSDHELGVILKERGFQMIRDEAARDEAASALRDAEDDFNSAVTRHRESLARFTQVEVVIDVRTGPEVAA